MRTICRSDLAGEIKAALTMDQVARHYGFEPNRAGFIRCPFRTGDRTASLKLYPGTGGWCCFGCRRGGSVIDFVMELYGLSFAQAVVRLSADLGLGAAGEGPGPAAARERAAEERRRALERAALGREYRDMAAVHLLLHEYVIRYAPARDEWERGGIDPVYAWALGRLPGVEHRCETLSRQLMEDGR